MECISTGKNNSQDNEHRDSARSRNGFVVDMGSCGEFTEDGRDNGLTPANVIEDQFDWHNDFVGQQHGFSTVAFAVNWLSDVIRRVNLGMCHVEC